MAYTTEQKQIVVKWTIPNYCAGRLNNEPNTQVKIQLIGHLIRQGILDESKGNQLIADISASGPGNTYARVEISGSWVGRYRRKEVEA